MKYEVFLVKYGSVILEAKNEEEAKEAVNNALPFFDLEMATESRWELDDIPSEVVIE